jgi:hypothetical protein
MQICHMLNLEDQLFVSEVLNVYIPCMFLSDTEGFFFPKEKTVFSTACTKIADHYYFHPCVCNNM